MKIGKTIRSAVQRLPSRGRVAVEIVRLGSAGLSAVYYATLGLGVHPAAAAGLAVIAGSLDYSKGAVIKASTEGRGVFRRLAGFAIFAVLFIASMVAVDGVLMQLRSSWTGGRAGAMAEYDRVQAAYKTADAELTRLAGTRTSQEVRGAMDKARVAKWAWTDSKECTDLTNDEVRKACKPILDLRVEMAAAIRKAELEAKRDEAREMLDSTKRPVAADPQAEVIANLLKPWGVSDAMVAYGMVAIIGFAVELVACFGLWVLGSKPHGGATVKPKPVTPPPAPKPDLRALLNIEPDAGPWSKSKAETDLVSRLAIGQRDTLADLGKRYQRSEAWVSRMVADLEGRGVIRARKDGRAKVLEIA